MTEESNPTDAEQTTEPKVEASQPKGDSQNSLTDDQIEQILKHPSIESRLGEIATQKAQSVKDKRFAGLETQVGEILADYQELIDENWSDAQAKRLLALQRQGSASEPEDSGSQPEQAGLDIQALLQAANLNPNSQQVQEAVKANTDNTSALLISLMSLAAEKEEPSTGAGVVPAEGDVSAKTNPIADMTQPEELLGEYFKNK